MQAHEVRRPVSDALGTEHFAMNYFELEPGEFQMADAREEAGNRVVGWALGAPGSTHDREDLESLVHCRECEDEHGHAATITDGGAVPAHLQ